MLNRRELIASTVALSVAAQAAAARTVAPVSGGSVDAAGIGAPLTEGPVRYFIASLGLPEARPAARAAEASGATVLWLGTDVTPVYTRLDLELRPAPFAVAGLTSTHHLFVIERLGWDRGVRTVRRASQGTAVTWRLEPTKKVSDTNLKVSDTKF